MHNRSKIKKILRSRKSILFLVSVFILCVVQLPIRKVVSQKIANHARYYFNGGEYNLLKAKSLYKKSLALDKNNWTAHYQLARIYLVESDFENGLYEIDQALRVDPEKKRSYYIRGLLDGYAKNYDEAEKDFQSFIAWAPDEWAGYMDLSWVYLNNNKFDKAAMITDNALDLFPSNVWLYANKGLAEYKLGRYEEAEKDLKVARSLSEKLTAEDWAWAYPGNDSKNSEKGVAEIRTAIDYNLKLVYEVIGSRENSDNLKISSGSLRSLSKYAGKNDLRSGVALSACCSSHDETSSSSGESIYHGAHDCAAVGQCCTSKQKWIRRIWFIPAHWATIWQCTDGKSWSEWNPKRNTVCSGIPFSQSRYNECGGWRYRSVTGTRNCNTVPSAIIDVPDKDGMSFKKNDNVSFVGHGTDSDGSIIGQEWAVNCPSTGCTNANKKCICTGASCVPDAGHLCDPDPSDPQNKSIFQRSFGVNGLHTIFYRVRDNDNKWSEYTTRVVNIGSYYDLTVSIMGSGLVSLTDNNGNLVSCSTSCSYSFDDGDLVTLTAISGSGYKFKRWTIGGNPGGSNNPRTVTMNSNKSVVAVFEADSVCAPLSPDSQYCQDNASKYCRGTKFPEENCDSYVCEGSKDCTEWSETGP